MGMAGDPGRSVNPIPWADKAVATPAAAARQNTDPPASTTACARPMRFSGASASVSRVPGPPPRTSTPAGQSFAHRTTVTPDCTRSSVACPTVNPGTSVMRFLGPGRYMASQNGLLLVGLRRDHGQSLQHQIRHDLPMAAHAARDHSGVAPGDEPLRFDARALFADLARPIGPP